MKKLNSWVVGIHTKMKQYGISEIELAQKLGKSIQWVSYVLNGKREAAESKKTFTAAIDEIIKERSA